MQTPTTIWRIPRAAWLMVSLAVSAEATSNALRAYDLGSHLERLTITVDDMRLSLAGLVLVLAAVAVSLSQTRAAWVALTPGDKRQRIVSGIAACLLLSISVTAMASHILSAQRAKSGDETTDRNGYTTAKAAYEKASAELSKVEAAPSVAEVEAEIMTTAASEIDANIWRRTKECTDVTKQASRDACRPVLSLRATLATAKRKAELEAALPDLKADFERRHLTEAASDSETAVSWGWAWIMGLGVVMIATFGPAIFAKVETIEAKADVAEFRPIVPRIIVADDDAAQTDFDPTGAGDVAGFFRPDQGGARGNGPGPKPGQAGLTGLSKEQALSDILRRLTAGETIPSQDSLASDWNRPKQTVSDWLRDWRRIGVVPAPIRTGRFKATVAG